MADRERVGREASPTAVVLDSQSVKTTESGGPSGYDAGKKVKGRKRQVMVGTDGRGLILEPQAASVQDRDGAPIVLSLSRRSFPFVTKAFADSGYAGERAATATSIDVEIVRKPKDQVGFAVHPRRWAEPARAHAREAGGVAGGGRRKVVRLDQPQPAPLEGPGGDDRIGKSLPLRGLRHDPRQASPEGRVIIGTDSQQKSRYGALGGFLPHFTPVSMWYSVCMERLMTDSMKLRLPLTLIQLSGARLMQAQVLV